jgi:hypothetical protein
MKKTPIFRPAKQKGQFLSPFSGRAYKVTESMLFPGLRNEPMPLLSFILRVLNGKHCGMVRQHLEYFLTTYFQNQTPMVTEVLRQLHDDPALLRYAIDNMTGAMQEMADMWIDSGKSPTDNDVDTPADRNVEVVLPRRSDSLFLKIYDFYLKSDKRYPKMRPDGSLDIPKSWPRFDMADFGGGWFCGPNDIEDALARYGESWAAFHFCGLLDSRYSRHISRCDHCKAYFVYQRARLRTVKHGVFCPACDGKASVNRTKSSRDRRLDTAARAWVEWESKRKGTVQPEWIAGEVNKSHGTAFGKRWVNQNRAEIQKRMEVLRNAKG